MYFMEKKCKLIESKKLYGFDCGKKHKFVKLVFGNMNTFNVIKNLWFNPKAKSIGHLGRI